MGKTCVCGELIDVFGRYTSEAHISMCRLCPTVKPFYLSNSLKVSCLHQALSETSIKIFWKHKMKIKYRKMTICYSHSLNSDVTLRLLLEYLYFRSFYLSENVKSNIFIGNSTNSIGLYQKNLLEFRFSGTLKFFMFTISFNSLD